MIEISLSEEQESLRELAARFSREVIRPAAASCDESEKMDWSLFDKAQQIGLTNFYISEEYGGGGITDCVTHALICEELSWGCAGIAANFLGAMGIANALRDFGTEQQRSSYLPRLAGPGYRAAIAMTETGAGSDAAAIRSRARRLADGSYVLDGSKSFITNGGIADLILVFATIDPERKSKGITAFLVERSNVGFKVGRKEAKMGARAAGSWEIYFENLHLPASSRLGEEGAGFMIASRAFINFRTIVAARAVGIARAALEYASAYAKERKTFGKTLLEHQGIAFKLAGLATQLEAARLLVWSAADAANRGLNTVQKASMAKLFATDVAMETTTEAVQVLGSYGYSREHPVEKWMRDAKGQQILEGPNEIQKLIISRHL